MTQRTIILLLAAAGVLAAANNAADFYSKADLQAMTAKLSAESKAKGGAFAGETLARYGNHLTMMAHRESTGSSELHVKDNDVLVGVDGDATLITGGKMVKPHNEGPLEVRGTGITGGQSRQFAAGDVVHINKNTPHLLILAPGHTITYFVVKITQ